MTFILTRNDRSAMCEANGGESTGKGKSLSGTFLGAVCSLLVKRLSGLKQSKPVRPLMRTASGNTSSPTTPARNDGSACARVWAYVRETDRIGTSSRTE